MDLQERVTRLEFVGSPSVVPNGRGEGPWLTLAMYNEKKVRTRKLELATRNG